MAVVNIRERLYLDPEFFQCFDIVGWKGIQPVINLLPESRKVLFR